MSKIVILNRKKIQLYAVIAAVVILAGAYIGWQQTKTTAANVSSDAPQVLQMVTGEFTAMLDGKKIESYQFAPSSVYAKKGQPVELRISGVNGQSHPFVIEGQGIKGTINKGKTTVVRFTPKEAGVFAIVCQTHADPKDGGPMVGYLIVD
ncbi:cupredoxin domain-containing protein [Cohnella suwonensis]|uniref:Cupredoxin domain-containing protein n=1 Tax=Cohnella suwonensis TaxID=696072 RepID=A0ABW0LSB8_9BACL